MAHTFTNLLTHIIFSTKGRLPTIDPILKPRLLPYMGGIIRELGGTTLIINSVSDHVHILAALPPSLALSDAMRDIKANTSRWVHETFPTHHNFAWQIGYGGFSVSRSAVPQVTQYIANQEAHHAKLSFQDEFIGFLARHEIEYDPRYIWE